MSYGPTQNGAPPDTNGNAPAWGGQPPVHGAGMPQGPASGMPQGPASGMPQGPASGMPQGPAPGAQPYPAQPYVAQAQAMPLPAPARKKRGRAATVALCVIAAALAVLVFVFCIGTVAFMGGISSLLTPTGYSTTPPNGSFSVITVFGAIQNTSSDALGINEPSYHHGATVNHIKQLAESDSNHGILLYLNTPGGGVFESDEVYLALMDYKEKTGRPIWAYMGPTCASGGYYICAAADYIVANRNTTTGSIGVYIALTDTSGLYEKLGIETVLVKSGDNKGVGTSGVAITPQQREVYQSIVDESYQQFIGLVAEGRDMKLDEVRTLADGRVYTGPQAVENGLVDDLGDWDSILEEFGEETGAQPFYPNFSRRTALGSMLGGLRGLLPQGDAEAALQAADALPNGVLMAYYQP